MVVIILKQKTLPFSDRVFIILILILVLNNELLIQCSVFVAEQIQALA